ncbi:hypothetical protein U1Q18_017418 [Sarracenia purpurea var. burkii]
MPNHRNIEPAVGSKAIVTSLTWSFLLSTGGDLISYRLAEQIAISSFKTHSTIGRDDSNDLERTGFVFVRSNAESSQN